MVRKNSSPSSTLKICAIKRFIFSGWSQECRATNHLKSSQNSPTACPNTQAFSTVTRLTPSGDALSIESQRESFSPSHSVRIIHESESPFHNLQLQQSEHWGQSSCRPSSGEVLLWKSAKVPALERLVHSVNEGVDHLPHGSAERVEGGVLGPRAFEVAVLVAVSAEQPLLGWCDVQKCRDEAELREQSRLQVFVMHHQQTAAPLQPAQSVRRPPGGVAGDKLWPFCEVQTWVTVSGQKKGSAQSSILKAMPGIFKRQKIITPISLVKNDIFFSKYSQIQSLSKTLFSLLAKNN